MWHNIALNVTETIHLWHRWHYCGIDDINVTSSSHFVNVRVWIVTWVVQIWTVQKWHRKFKCDNNNFKHYTYDTVWTAYRWGTKIAMNILSSNTNILAKHINSRWPTFGATGCEIRSCEYVVIRKAVATYSAVLTGDLLLGLSLRK